MKRCPDVSISFGFAVVLFWLLVLNKDVYAGHTSRRVASRKRNLVSTKEKLLVSNKDILASHVSMKEASTKQKFVCPSGCLLVEFTYSKAVSECASCYPPESKWRCPVNRDDNAYERAFEASESSGFGTWTRQQCVYEEYSPSWLAFSGPAEYDGYFVPTCPTSTFCACGTVKDDIKKLWSHRDSLPLDKRNDVYWASLAGDEYSLYRGFSSVTGGSWTHFDVVYEHTDGRKQFCGGVKSFTYSPQDGMGWNSEDVDFQHTYETPCAWSVWSDQCDQDAGFVEKSSESCGFWQTKRTCEAKRTAQGNYPRIVENENSPIKDAVAFSPQWYDAATCSKKCGGGERVSRCHVGAGSGDAGGKYCSSEAGARSTCNDQACRMWTSSYYSWSPEACPSGFSWKSTAWSWYGGRKYTCQETA